MNSFQFALRGRSIRRWKKYNPFYEIGFRSHARFVLGE